MQTSPASASQSTPLERHLNLTVPAVEIESEIASRLRKLAKTVKMQGFRPGKVPLSMVAKHYGYQVRQEVVNDTVYKSFSEAVRAANYRVAGNARFAPANSGQNADKFEFTATFEVYPEVQLGTLAGKKLNKPDTVVGDKEIDNTLNTLRKQRATFDKVERAAENSDFVVIDFAGKIGGVPFEGGSAENFGVVLGEKRMLPDFEAALIGMKQAESKTFDLAFPADYNPELAGKTAQFEVTVKVVNAPKLPEVDAAFAKSLGVPDGDIQKMRDEIKHNLEREAKKRVQAKIKDQVMDALIASATLDIPRSLVDIEIGRLQEGARQDLEQRGMTAKDLQLPPELFVERAERRVKLGLILAELVKKNSLLAKPEQVRAVIEDIAESYEQPQQMVKWYYSQPERVGEVEALVAEDNVVEWASTQMDVTAEKVEFDQLMGIERT
jgi:trigger factor